MKLLKLRLIEVIVKYKEGTLLLTSLSTLSAATKVLSINQKVVVNTGDKVKEGDVLIEGMSIAGWRTSSW